MFNMPLRQVNVGTRFAILACAVAALIIACFTVAVTHSTGQLLTEQALSQIDHDDQAIATTVSLYNKTVSAEVTRSMTLFQSFLTGNFTIDTSATAAIGGQNIPTLRNGDTTLNGDFTVPDQFLQRSGAISTIFVRHGDDFSRITTSLKKQDGARAIGTDLDRLSPAYRAIVSGKSYIGIAFLFGKHYITAYKPVTNAEGQIIGALFVGVDVSTEIAALQQTIRDLHIGGDGYYFVVDASSGPGRGTLLVHPGGEGQPADERIAPFAAMLAQRQGRVQFTAQASADVPFHTTKIHDGVKDIVFRTLPEWQWLIGGVAYQDDLLAGVRAARDRYLLIGVVVIGLFIAVLLVAVRKMIGLPLAALTRTATQIAEGDLTVRLSTHREDDVGRLMHAVDGTAIGLSRIVTQVRQASSAMSEQTERIAAGSATISERITHQAANLEETAASMEQMTSIVQQNASNTAHADTLVVSATHAANAGGDAVKRVVSTMGDIEQSSRKISDITTMIEAIAFQTNILALNAAVEAARAGEHGRGFAVVANEVRVLAQRSTSAVKDIEELMRDSADKVATGYRRVEEAHTTMAGIVEHVAHVGAILSEITIASREQSTGIEQVNQAVTQIGESTQQNATLVGDAELAAGELREQAAKLQHAVSVFRI